MHSSISLQVMRPEDYPECLVLWQHAGVQLREWENRAAVQRLIRRNPYLCWTATHDRKIIGTILAGHDSWRGYLYHLTVAPSFRRMGVARQLVRATTRQMSEHRINRIHAFVDEESDSAKSFWPNIGWVIGADIAVFLTDLTTKINGSTI